MKTLFNWIKNHFNTWLNVPGHDKDAHVICCAIIALTVGSLWNLTFYFTGHDLNSGGAFIGLITAIVVGALKELVWDRLMGNGVCSLWDFIPSCYGSILGAIHVAILFNLTNGVAVGFLNH